MSEPLVTVICLCYNQQRFVSEALQSVQNQTYSNIQLIVIDDASTDNSAHTIQTFLQNFPSVLFLELRENLGMTRAFNIGLSQAAGEYIVDLAGDDVLQPDRIEKQVRAFQQLDSSYGVVFSDAYLMDEQSRKTGTFYRRNADGLRKQLVPGGDVYTQVLHSYCICAPTIMSRKHVYHTLGGYDEALVYEDFDFFVRSARHYKYFYIDEALTCYRKSPGSDSTKFYCKRHNPHLISTLAVCRKAYLQNRTMEENKALANQVRYHLRQSYLTENFDLVDQYAALLKQVDKVDWLSSIIRLLAQLRWRTGPLPRWYFNVRYRLSQKPGL